MKSYSSREVIKALQADGWYQVNELEVITNLSTQPKRGE